MDKISAYLVFMEGLASFLSPCLLPLLPIYIGYFSGEMLEGRYNKKLSIINTVFFCIGMTVIFVLMGITASSIGRFLNDYKHILLKASAVIIIIFGLFHMEIIKIGFLYKERRFSVNFKKFSIINSFLFGATFAFGWTPCIGPMLGSVLILAGSSGSVIYGAYLLLIYALGLSIPFLITSILMKYIALKLKNIQKYSRVINIVSGLILIIMGIALYNGWLQRIAYLSWR